MRQNETMEILKVHCSSLKKREAWTIFKATAMTVVLLYGIITICLYTNAKREQCAYSNATKSRYKFRAKELWPTNETFMLPNERFYRTKVFQKLYRPIRNSAGLNCSQVVRNNQTSILEAHRMMEDPNFEHPNLEPSFFWQLQSNLSCEEFRSSRGYITHPLSNIELHFPLAYGILAYKDVALFERLLRAIYRPQNYYCLHLDSKTDADEKLAFEKIVSCFDNVILSNISVDVRWGEFSLLEAELVCMKVLWKYKKWKYYINLTGQEFPLKTNRDIVSILKVMNGANIVEGSLIRGQRANRWRRAGIPPPHGINLVKGSVHIAANRDFVRFIVFDEKAHDFLEWSKLTRIPDETYFPSLNHSPHLGILGSFLGDCEVYALKPFFLRYVVWSPGESESVRNCSGKYVRTVCILGVGDLYRAYNSVALYANKFHTDFEPLALDCIEELLHEKTWKQYVDDSDTDIAYYSHLDYAKLNLKAK